MNIFILSEDPVEAAQMMCDKHVVKMVTESAQMLSSAHRLLDGVNLADDRENVLYKIAHPKHPCTLWTMESTANYDWHYLHYLALAEEYTLRYGKEHGAFSRTSNIGDMLSRWPQNLSRGPLTPFAIAMQHYPQCITPDDPVRSYRNYYRTAKTGFAKWEKGRPAPSWYS